MYSCDTFALGKNWYFGGKNCLAKNSDRPQGEAQPLEFFPGGDHQPGEMLQCTGMTIPQVPHTYTVLGSRPYWIWGFEMGVNECGLAIGNEAEWSRCEAETMEGLLGMDLLRLGLERAATAREGVEVITGLLEKYGQNANAHPSRDRRYENSFMLVDREEIWLLETAGRQWVARQVHDWAAISNCYTISDHYDLCSEGLEKLAREKRRISPKEKFEFAKAYSNVSKMTGSLPRWRRLCKRIGENDGPLKIENIQSILRDHFDGELISPRWSAMHGTFVTICMHAATAEASQTAASLISAWHDVLGPVSWYAPSVPCCSVYIPVYWTGNTPDAMKHADGKYDENSLWWCVERLSLLISTDEERFAPGARTALMGLERKIREGAVEAEERACELIAKGLREAAFGTLAEYTEACVAELMELAKSLAGQISAEIDADGGLYGSRKEYVEDYAARVDMPL